MVPAIALNQGPDEETGMLILGWQAYYLHNSVDHIKIGSIISNVCLRVKEILLHDTIVILNEMYEFLVGKKVLKKKEIVLNNIDEALFDFGKRSEGMISPA